MERMNRADATIPQADPATLAQDIVFSASDLNDFLECEHLTQLEETRRMHPDVCRFISEVVYEDRLKSIEPCALQRIDSAGLAGIGIRYFPVSHIAAGECALPVARLRTLSVCPGPTGNG
jgi:hypothetical protein